MKKIYIDADYRCHTEYAEGLTAAETDFFDGKCDEFIEGYRFVPEGESWVREDGVEFRGEMASPHRPYPELERVQNAWEKEQYEEAIDRLLLLI